MVLTERMFGITLLAKFPRCAPNEMAIALIDKLKHLPRQMRRSITFDNGQENGHHQRLQQEVEFKIKKSKRR